MSLRIAMVSYEYPPDNACGGIGTYAKEAAELLVRRGHSVEVFAASNRRSGHFENQGMGINLVGEMNRLRFAPAIAPVFSERHAICNFDVLESPEYFADGRDILRSHPTTPHVVKLHTPNQLIRSSSSRPSLMGWTRYYTGQMRVMAGALRRGKRPQLYPAYQRLKPADVEMDALERNYVKQCSLVVSPSRSLAEWAIREWGVAPRKTLVVPNPYSPSTDLLSISPESHGKVVGFFGRLEYRKGICDLVEAVPSILNAEPEAAFRFVGSPLFHPVTNEPFDQFVLRKLRKVARSITLVGPVQLRGMPAEYSKVDVCVFPSIWENFPYVCLEAMSAARAIVAGNAGGMAEMLDGDCGLLIPPKDPRAIADSVIRLLRSDDLRARMGRTSRKRVLERYSVESIGPQIEKSYADAISISGARKGDQVSR
jgi:glycosyltransferase involved in cell wall biosynthesis